MAEKAFKVYLKIRTYINYDYADMWLMHRDGAAESCLMHGKVLKSKSDMLERMLAGRGVWVEREERPLSPEEKLSEGPQSDNKGGMPQAS